MKAEINLVDPEETFVCEIDARDRRAFEIVGARSLKLNLAGDLAVAIKTFPETYVAWLSWHSLARREGKEIGTFEQYELRLISVLVDDEDTDELPDPTKLVASGGN